MTKTQSILIGASIAVFAILYFGCDTTTKKQQDLEKSRSINIESTSISNLLVEANKSLNPKQKSIVDALHLDLDKVGTDTVMRVQILKSLSGAWYELGYPAIAGSYAQDVATFTKDEEAWSLTGTTYALCVKNAGENVKEKEFCSKRAVQAFEKAISINPSNLDNRVNLAICYVDNPIPDNPMQGILMLREMNKEHPNNVTVLNQLGKLAIQTNQIDKALTRLENAIQLEPENKITICLLADAYTASGNKAKAEEYSNKCKH
jgi:tetratricopeptide (TPR) repeat protein